MKNENNHYNFTNQYIKTDLEKNLLMDNEIIWILEILMGWL